MKIKRKLYRTWSGIKGAAKSLKYAIPSMFAGIVIAVIPALIARIFGKKAFLITEALGAGLGLGLLVYLGYKEGISSYDYKKRLEEDPKFRKEESEKDRKELEKYLSNKLKYNIPNYSEIVKTLKNVEKDFNISFKDDLYKYIKYYDSFYKRYNKTWYSVFKGCSIKDIDIEFNYIFPEPVFQYDILQPEEGSICQVAGSLEYLDHGFLYYDTDNEMYSFELGFGYDSKSISETIIKRCEDFKGFYNKSRTDKEYLNIVKTHTDIINKFIEGLKSL